MSTYLPWNFSESANNYHKKRTKTLVEAYARCITENITKRWLRQTLVVERGIAVSYKYNPLASVPVPEICVPVLCSRAQKVAVIVIKRKCRLIPDLPAPVAQLFVPGGSVDIMTNIKTSSRRILLPCCCFWFHPVTWQSCYDSKVNRRLPRISIYFLRQSASSINMRLERISFQHRQVSSINTLSA